MTFKILSLKCFSMKHEGPSLIEKAQMRIHMKHHVFILVHTSGFHTSEFWWKECRYYVWVSCKNWWLMSAYLVEMFSALKTAFCGRHYYYPHSSDEVTGVRGRDHLPTITQLISSRAGIWSKSVCLQGHCSCWLENLLGPIFFSPFQKLPLRWEDPWS